MQCMYAHCAKYVCTMHILQCIHMCTLCSVCIHNVQCICTYMHIVQCMFAHYAVYVCTLYCVCMHIVQCTHCGRMKQIFLKRCWACLYFIYLIYLIYLIYHINLTFQLKHFHTNSAYTYTGEHRQQRILSSWT